MTDDLARQINAAARLEGSFLLRSGQTSAHYFDKYRFEGDPRLLRRVALRMLKLVPSGAEVLAGLELGGVPIATAMSLEGGLPAVFVRKEAKTYGTCRAVEGGEARGRKVVIVEDVISTGGAVADAAKLLTDDGAELIAVVCAIWRGEGEPAIRGLPDLPVRAAFTQADLAAASRPDEAQPSDNGVPAKATYRGACHCGRVQFEVDAILDHVRVCDCSICRKRGALIHRVDPDALRLVTPLDDLQLYRWHTHVARDYFCATCGILPFRRPRTAEDVWGVNVRCLDGVDLDAIPVRRVWGSWLP